MMFLLLLIAGPLTIVLVYQYFTKNQNYWKNLGVPYAKSNFLTGSLWPLIKQEISRGDFFGNLYTLTSHPFYGFFTLLQPSLLIRDLTLIKNILIKDFDYFSNRQGGDGQSDKIASNFLFFLKDEKWKRMRNHLSPLFSSGKLKNMFPFLQDVGDNLVKYINKQIIGRQSIKCMDIVCMYNTDIIATCFFGFLANALDDGDKNFYIMSEQLTNSNFLRNLQTICIFMFPKLGNFFRVKFFNPTSEKFLQNLFLEVMEIRKKKGFVRGDLVDLLIKIQKEDTINNSEIFAQPLQFHFAGFDTSCNAVAFTIIELCLNPKIQITLREEIHKVLAKRGRLSYEALQEMNYLNMVVTESLRLHPIVPIVDRVCNKSYNIPGTKVIIEEGTPVVISVYGIHHDAAYFPNPDKFDPERFAEKNKSKLIPGSYIPFGDGPRNCIALRFGLLSVKVAIVKIISNFEIELGQHLKLPIKYDVKNIFLTPNNKLLDIKFKPVNKW